MTVELCNPDSGRGRGTTHLADGTTLTVVWSATEVDVVMYTVMYTTTYARPVAPVVRRVGALTNVSASGTFTAGGKTVSASVDAWCRAALAAG